jgi:hypothetical protein
MPAIHGVTLTMVLHARGSGDAVAVAAGADHLAARCAGSSA